VTTPLAETQLPSDKLPLAACSAASSLRWQLCPLSSKQATVNCLKTLSLLLNSDDIFQPIAVENLGSFNSSTSSFYLSNLGNKIRALSGEDKETSFLSQCISVLIQRFNSDSFAKDGLDQ